MPYQGVVPTELGSLPAVRTHLLFEFAECARVCNRVPGWMAGTFLPVATMFFTVSVGHFKAALDDLSHA
jgi:hypothetical protein